MPDVVDGITYAGLGLWIGFEYSIYIQDLRNNIMGFRSCF